jgi:hypothetical protein
MQIVVTLLVLLHVNVAVVLLEVVTSAQVNYEYTNYAMDLLIRTHWSESMGINRILI